MVGRSAPRRQRDADGVPRRHRRRLDTITRKETLEVASRVLRARGTIVKAGVHGPMAWEWTPLYFKELSWVGSNAFGFEEVEGVRKHGIQHYLDLAESGRSTSRPCSRTPSRSTSGAPRSRPCHPGRHRRDQGRVRPAVVSGAERANHGGAMTDDTTFDWPGTRVLLTGASSGIGAALARELARAGAVVGMCARRTEMLDAVLGRLPESLAAVAGVDDRPRRHRRDRRVRGAGGRGAGRRRRARQQRRDVQLPRPARSRPVSDVEYLMRCKLPVAGALTRALLPAMVERGIGSGGHGVVDGEADVVVPGESAYSASTGRVVGLVRGHGKRALDQRGALPPRVPGPDRARARHRRRRLGGRHAQQRRGDPGAGAGPGDDAPGRARRARVSCRSPRPSLARNRALGPARVDRHDGRPGTSAPTVGLGDATLPEIRAPGRHG